jgi:urease accessory protein
MKRSLPFAPMAALIPVTAFAHTGHVGSRTAFAEGVLHPLGGADHLLAMVAVGLWAATATDRRGIWALPLTFITAMILGGILGAKGIALPAVEPMILASSVVLGLAVALALRPSLAVALPVVAVFGLMHGHAHGAEGPAAGPVAGLAGYAAGFVLATGALHLTGIALGRFGATRLIGAATAALGAGLAVLA